MNILFKAGGIALGILIGMGQGTPVQAEDMPKSLMKKMKKPIKND